MKIADHEMRGSSDIETNCKSRDYDYFSCAFLELITENPGQKLR